MEGDCVDKSSSDHQKKVDANSKDQQLEQFRVNNDGKKTDDQSRAKSVEDEESLKAGVRGPTLMEDFHFREKITHFDHERIPERVVHARGYAAHGEFELYESMKEYHKSGFSTETWNKNSRIY